MPLYSDHNYYNGASPSAYHLPISSYLSPTSRISTPYSFSYMSPITSMLSSGIGTNPMPRGLRSYSPMLSAIPESSSPLMSRRDISGHRNSPRHLPVKTYYQQSRPIVIDTENIDVSKRKKEETELESTPGLISRSKTTVRMHTKKLKENPELKKKKTQAELLMEKYLIKEKPIKEEEIPKRKRIWEEREEQKNDEPAMCGNIKRSNTIQKKGGNNLQLPDDIVSEQTDSAILPRKMSIDSELLKEEAALFDCMIQEELGTSNLKEMDVGDDSKNDIRKTKKGNHVSARKKSSHDLFSGEENNSTLGSNKSNTYRRRSSGNLFEDFKSNESSLDSDSSKESTNTKMNRKKSTVRKKRVACPLIFKIDSMHVEEKSSPKALRKFKYEVIVEEGNVNKKGSVKQSTNLENLLIQTHIPKNKDQHFEKLTTDLQKDVDSVEKSSNKPLILDPNLCDSNCDINSVVVDNALQTEKKTKVQTKPNTKISNVADRLNVKKLEDFQKTDVLKNKFPKGKVPDLTPNVKYIKQIKTESLIKEDLMTKNIDTSSKRNKFDISSEVCSNKNEKEKLETVNVQNIDTNIKVEILNKPVIIENEYDRLGNANIKNKKSNGMLTELSNSEIKLVSSPKEQNINVITQSAETKFNLGEPKQKENIKKNINLKGEENISKLKEDQVINSVNLINKESKLKLASYKLLNPQIVGNEKDLSLSHLNKKNTESESLILPHGKPFDSKNNYREKVDTIKTSIVSPNSDDKLKVELSNKIKTQTTDENKKFSKNVTVSPCKNIPSHLNKGYGDSLNITSIQEIVSETSKVVTIDQSPLSPKEKNNENTIKTGNAINICSNNKSPEKQSGDNNISLAPCNQVVAESVVPNSAPLIVNKLNTTQIDTKKSEIQRKEINDINKHDNFKPGKSNILPTKHSEVNNAVMNQSEPKNGKIQSVEPFFNKGNILNKGAHNTDLPAKDIKKALKKSIPDQSDNKPSNTPLEGHITTDVNIKTVSSSKTPDVIQNKTINNENDIKNETIYENVIVYTENEPSVQSNNKAFMDKLEVVGDTNFHCVTPLKSFADEKLNTVISKSKSTKVKKYCHPQSLSIDDKNNIPDRKEDLLCDIKSVDIKNKKKNLKTNITESVVVDSAKVDNQLNNPVSQLLDKPKVTDKALSPVKIDDTKAVLKNVDFKETPENDVESNEAEKSLMKDNLNCNVNKKKRLKSESDVPDENLSSANDNFTVDSEKSKDKTSKKSKSLNESIAKKKKKSKEKKTDNALNKKSSKSPKKSSGRGQEKMQANTVNQESKCIVSKTVSTTNLEHIVCSETKLVVEDNQKTTSDKASNELSKRSTRLMHFINKCLRLSEDNESIVVEMSDEDDSSSSEYSSDSEYTDSEDDTLTDDSSDECDVNCHKKCEKLMPNLCGVNQKLIVEALSSLKKGSSDAHEHGSGSPTRRHSNAALSLDEVKTERHPGPGRVTPPATTIPKFRKYTMDDFQFLKVLGKGSFGKVLLAELRGTQYYYAVKCLKKDVVLEDDDVECTLIERKVLALGTNHPYLCHLFCTFQTDSHLFFVMEYLNGGDLMFHIQQQGRFDEGRARFYAAEIVSGLKFLHKKGIVYRDLKLDNILLDFDGHVRIADFGMCKLQIYLDRTADTFCGTPDYMAPEIIKGLKYNQCVDWWSFGILLYEMLVGQSPFSGCDEDDLFWCICNRQPHYPRFITLEAKTILMQLLEKEASKRLGSRENGAEEVMGHSFFNGLDWNRLEHRELIPPFKPNVKHPLDVHYFDKHFTAEQACLTPIDPSILQSMDQAQFQGFSYTNPNVTD